MLFPVLEVTSMVPSFLQEAVKTSKRIGASSFEKFTAVRPSFPGDLLCFRVYRFYKTSRDISALKRLKCSLDIFFLLGILLRNSLVAAVEVCLV